MLFRSLAEAFQLASTRHVVSPAHPSLPSVSVVKLTTVGAFGDIFFHVCYWSGLRTDPLEYTGSGKFQARFT